MTGVRETAKTGPGVGLSDLKKLDVRLADAGVEGSRDRLSTVRSESELRTFV